MKRKSLIALSTGLVLSVAGFAAPALANSNNNTPAEIVADVTGKTTEEVIAEKLATGKTYGTIAAEAGKLEEFKGEKIKVKEQKLQESVVDGKITQEQADKKIEQIKQNQADCDGSGTGQGIYQNSHNQNHGRTNENNQNSSHEHGKHSRNHDGSGTGAGHGSGLRDGSCNK